MECEELYMENKYDQTEELQQLCDELFNMTDGRYTVMGQSRMGTPDEVNGILHRIRELTNIDALKSELERLKQ